MRIVARWGAALLVASFFAVVGGSSPAHAAFTTRWCSVTPAAPCVQSLQVAGSDIHPGGGIHLDFDAPFWSDGNGGKDLQFFLQGANAGDPVVAVVDLGSHHPDKVFGLQEMSDIDVSQNASGHWILRMKGAAIRYANGCDSSSPTWPWPCPTNATDDQVLFEGDVVSGLPSDMVGYYMGTNVTNNDISISPASDGTPFIETEAISPRNYSDGTTPVHGSMHFRLPYVMMREDFGIPNPETMTAGSLAGTVSGTSATFAIAQDPDGGGIYVDVSGFGFPVASSSARLRALTTVKRTIKVRVGTIKPTKPVITKAKRVSGRRIWLTHTLSKPRGAKVTGYVARCVNGSTVKTGTALRTATGIGIGGLRAGKAYDCRVAATSKVGRSAWSTAVHVRRA